MSFLYPRTIAIRRQNADNAVGGQPYGGVTQANETVIASGLAARIEADRRGTTPEAKLPADAAGESLWKIMFKATLGLVQSRDIIVDDLGNRYQVISADWNPMLTTCLAQIMET